MKKILSCIALLIFMGAGCSSKLDIDTMPESESTQKGSGIEATVNVINSDNNVDTFTMADVNKHSSESDCYTAVNGSVYDVTNWISRHPGGKKAILSLCGKDGTSGFQGQHGGQPRPENELASFKIGTLVQ